MTLLYHHRTLGDGAEGIHVQEMILAFRNLGQKVVVLSPVGEGTNQPGFIQSWGERIKKFLPRVFFECLEIAYNLPAFLNLWRLVKREKPIFLYERYVTFNASGVIIGKLLGLPVVLEVNAPLALERSQEPDEALILKRLANAMERWICAQATHTLVVSTPLKKYLQSVGVPESKVKVVANGVNLSRFTPRLPDQALRAKLGIPADAKVLGFVGIMRPWHGIDLLLEAFAELGDKVAGNRVAGSGLYLLLVGDSPIQQELDAMIQKLGIQKQVRITGRVSHADIPAYISLIDIALSPKATFYASPMKILEYMALGKPVVAPDMENIRDILVDGQDGRLFIPGSKTSLVSVLAEMIGDPDATAAMGVAARQKTIDSLNWENNARTVLGWVGIK